MPGRRRERARARGFTSGAPPRLNCPSESPSVPDRSGHRLNAVGTPVGARGGCWSTPGGLQEAGDGRQQAERHGAVAPPGRALRPGNRTPTTLTVVASTSQFSVLDGLARRWSADKPTIAGHCVAVTVARKESSAVASALGPSWDETRDGPRPDVWVPESSLWLLVAGSHPTAQPILPDHAPSTASSPVVLALRRPVAEALGWPQRPLGWEDVLGAFVRPDTWAKVGHPEWATLRLGMTDPTVSTAGLASALALLDQDGDNQLSDIEI